MKIQEAYQIIKDELIHTYGEREAGNLARYLLEDLFGFQSPYGQQVLSRSQRQSFENARRLLTEGIPLQYVTGIAHFYGLKLEVNQHVLIPRPETEELVFHVLKYCKGRSSKVLDLGTGSGCIALALKNELPELKVVGIDKSENALEVARQNASKHKLDIEWLNGDLLDAGFWSNLPECDVIVSNPPYIPRSEVNKVDKHVFQHEPHMALFTEDSTGLIFYDQIATGGKEILRKDGRIFLECNGLRSGQIEDIFKTKGYKTILHKDMQGMDRILEARTDLVSS